MGVNFIFSYESHVQYLVNIEFQRLLTNFEFKVQGQIRDSHLENFDPLIFRPTNMIHKSYTPLSLYARAFTIAC